MKFAAIVLAAGLARRMDGPNKLLLMHRGKPLVSYAVAAACASSAERVVLVTGRDGDEVAQAAGTHAKLTRTHNANAADGLASSLKLGLTAIFDADAVAILLGDMPEIDAPLLDTLFAAWRADAYALAPTHNGELGNPVLLSHTAMRDCETLTGDRGARKLIETHPGLLRVAVETRAIFADFDKPSDFVS